MNIRKAGRLILGISFILILLYSSFFLFSGNNKIINPGGVEYAIDNYQKDVKKNARKYNLPSAYLMSLIMLESSGRKNVKPRFEKHVYYKLLKLRDGKIDHFEDLLPKDLNGFSNEKIKSLAKSYGPYQIMGYKTIKLGITVNDLQGKYAIAYGTFWINKEYGNILRKGRFMDAFHLHNTGRVYPKSGKPKTHNPKYVQNGMDYMRLFSKND